MSKTNTILISLAVLVALIGTCLYTIYETDQAIVLRFKKIRLNNNDEPIIIHPGLHAKIPLVDEVRSFDMRLNTLDIKASRIITLEKKDVLVDYYVQWRINDLRLFYKRTLGRKSQAEALLQEKANSGLKIEFGRLTIKEVVSGERAELMHRLKKMTNENAANMGITVIDVRVKRIDLPKEVSESVYQRMRAERQRIANSFRADGEKKAIAIRAEADKKRQIILAEAEKQSKIIRGEGDAQAVEIYANTYKQAPDFYQFYRSIHAYENTFKSRNDILVLKPDSDFFKYFRQYDGPILNHNIANAQ